MRYLRSACAVLVLAVANCLKCRCGVNFIGMLAELERLGSDEFTITHPVDGVIQTEERMNSLQTICLSCFYAAAKSRALLRILSQTESGAIIMYGGESGRLGSMLAAERGAKALCTEDLPCSLFATPEMLYVRPPGSLFTTETQGISHQIQNLDTAEAHFCISGERLEELQNILGPGGMHPPRNRLAAIRRFIEGYGTQAVPDAEPPLSGGRVLGWICIPSGLCVKQQDALWEQDFVFSDDEAGDETTGARELSDPEEAADEARVTGTVGDASRQNIRGAPTQPKKDVENTGPTGLNGPQADPSPTSDSRSDGYTGSSSGSYSGGGRCTIPAFERPVAAQKEDKLVARPPQSQSHAIVVPCLVIGSVTALLLAGFYLGRPRRAAEQAPVEDPRQLEEITTKCSERNI
ncbi:hypothetical protein PAPHI01_2338 [Pancytospora philotis]|nr:hypothetical protein PAPHI01_2338 [Pancytospora philotis]